MKRFTQALLLILAFPFLAAAQTCPCSFWPNTATPGTADSNDKTPVELGLKFTAASDGMITGIRFYKGPNNTGTHAGHLWSSTGTLLASAAFTGETASGWQQANFTTPVAITANTTYVASYYSPTGTFAYNRNFFTAAFSKPPLTAPAGLNGVYAYAATSQFPTVSYLSTNYWVDVVYNNVVKPVPPVATVIAANVAMNCVVTPPVTSHSVVLTWSPSTSTVIGYNVYRASVSGGPYVMINGALLSVLTFTDATVKSGNSYFYVATAMNSSGQESIYSNEVSAVFP